MLIKVLLAVTLLIFTFANLYGQEKISVAVLDLDATGISHDDVQIISDRLRADLFNTGTFTVLERNKMEEILSEQGFQHSGCTSDECIIEIGKLIGVRLMVAGRVGKLGKLYTLILRMIDVQNGKVIRTATDDCECPIENVLTESVAKVANILAGRNQDDAQKRKSLYMEKRKEILKGELKSPAIAGITGLIIPIIGHSYIGTSSNIIRGLLYNIVGTGAIILGFERDIYSDGLLLFAVGVGLHVTSSIDAILSADNYNDKLLARGFTIRLNSHRVEKIPMLMLCYNF